MSFHQLIREAVLLTLIKGSDRIDRTGMINALGQIIPVSDIDSFGNLGNFSEWYVIFKTTNAREIILKNNEFKVGDQTFMISEPYKHVKIIRLLNVPPAISDDDIRSIASKWGGLVLNVDVEKLPQPFETIKTFVRRIRIRFFTRQDEEKVPISIRYNGYTFSVNLEGRQKVCYRCKQAGHIKAECKVLKCHKCFTLGHDDPLCQQNKSYAAAVSETPVNIFSTNSPSIQGDTGVESTPVGQVFKPTTASQKRKKKVCPRCQQSGHKPKDCSLQQNLNIQPGKEDTNNHVISVEEVQQTTTTLTNTKAVPENEDNVILDPQQSTLLEDQNEKAVVATIATSLQERIMYQAYKNSTSDFKRTCADRSIDSDLEVDPKKAHTYDSSTSVMDEQEEGEVNDQ